MRGTWVWGVARDGPPASAALLSLFPAVDVGAASRPGPGHGGCALGRGGLEQTRVAAAAVEVSFLGKTWARLFHDPRHPSSVAGAPARQAPPRNRHLITLSTMHAKQDPTHSSTSPLDHLVWAVVLDVPHMMGISTGCSATGGGTRGTRTVKTPAASVALADAAAASSASAGRRSDNRKRP